MLHLQRTAEDSFKPFHALAPCLIPFVGGFDNISTHPLSVRAMLQGFEKALSLNWYMPNSFNAEGWDYYAHPANGDMNWLIPNKLVGFASPHSVRKLPDGGYSCLPSDLVRPFKEMGVTRIVRLNEKKYDERVFLRAGFEHEDLPFADGGLPSPKIIDEFLKLIARGGVTAVHCQAGLGRTYVLTFRI
jgi:cell division cycle 14